MLDNLSLEQIIKPVPGTGTSKKKSKAKEAAVLSPADADKKRAGVPITGVNVTFGKELLLRES